jgi:hypothetical protein
VVRPTFGAATLNRARAVSSQLQCSTFAVVLASDPSGHQQHGLFGFAAAAAAAVTLAPLPAHASPEEEEMVLEELPEVSCHSQGVHAWPFSVGASKC